MTTGDRLMSEAKQWESEWKERVPNEFEEGPKLQPIRIESEEREVRSERCIITRVTTDLRIPLKEYNELHFKRKEWRSKDAIPYY